jgi:NitT/TauT family transport system permease protein
VGAALAIPAGIVISSKRWIEESMAYVVVFFRSLAPISILPVLIAIFGIGELSKIALIAFTCFWIVLTAVLTGMASVDASLLRAARSLDTNGPALRWRVMLPAALPTIFAGLRVALGIAFMVIVAAEMVATVRGLGALIQEARGSFRADITMVGMAVIGLIGWLSSLVLGAFERWLVPWGGVARGGPEA